MLKEQELSEPLPGSMQQGSGPTIHSPHTEAPTCPTPLLCSPTAAKWPRLSPTLKPPTCWLLKPTYPEGRTNLPSGAPGSGEGRAEYPVSPSWPSQCRRVTRTRLGLQATKVPLCGWSAEGRGAGPKLPSQGHSPACSGQMPGYSAENGRSFNENIYCELQNKT